MRNMHLWCMHEIYIFCVVSEQSCTVYSPSWLLTSLSHSLHSTFQSFEGRLKVIMKLFWYL